MFVGLFINLTRQKLSLVMAKQYLVVDAWIKEAQEATKLVEEIDARVKNKSLEQQHRHSDDLARSKLVEVGVKLDRLESLLHNPPSKPILTNEDLESRWRMLLDIQLRTKALAVSLFAMPSPTPNRQGDLAAADTKETDRRANSYDHGQIEASSPRYESELQKPLVSEDATQSHKQIKRHSSFISMSLLQKICWTIGIILGAAAFLFIVVIICAVI